MVAEAAEGPGGDGLAGPGAEAYDVALGDRGGVVPVQVGAA